MRRFKIGSAKALVWAGVPLTVWCGSAAPASAQTYDFTFSGASGSNSASITDGVVVLTGGNISSASGMLSGVSPSADNGSMSLLANFGGSYTSSSNYDFTFDVSTSPGGGEDTIALDPGTNKSTVFSTGGVYVGTSTATEEMTPAPIPGSGPLSYLAFGLGGLFINRKRLWRATRGR